jgi:hypothetical protein
MSKLVIAIVSAYRPRRRNFVLVDTRHAGFAGVRICRTSISRMTAVSVISNAASLAPVYHQKMTALVRISG